MFVFSMTNLVTILHLFICLQAAANNIPVDATPKAPYSLDANLYHTSYESGMLENPMTGPPKDMFRMTVDPEG